MGLEICIAGYMRFLVIRETVLHIVNRVDYNFAGYTQLLVSGNTVLIDTDMHS